MELEIVQKENLEKKEILVKFAKEILTISEDSQDWSNEGINNFLISLASKTPSDEKIIFKFNQENEDPTYKHIVGLFSEFVEEYNKTLPENN